MICSRCIYDSSVPNIEFDSNGVCNYCKQIELLKNKYKTGTKEGEEMINEIVDKIKNNGRKNKYDCVIGVSGGTDSSFMVYWAVKKGLRPLAVHYDNTWNGAIATENMRKVLNKLNVDLFTHVVNNKESDDIFKSFFLAGVPEIEAPTDLGLAETLYRVASRFKIKYVLEGHSFITEGVSPIGKFYFDGKYIKSIHNKFGSYKMKTYPLMTFWKFLKWTLLYRIQKIRPLWYIKYSKKDAQEFLKKEFDWKNYGGHHLENRMSAFFHSIYSPQKFNLDYRNNSISALVRSGMMKRKDAIKEYYENTPYIEPNLLEYFKKRMNLSNEEYETIIKSEPRYWQEFPTYKKRFEFLRPLFYILAKNNLVPMSFYLKYCFPVKSDKK